MSKTFDIVDDGKRLSKTSCTLYMSWCRNAYIWGYGIMPALKPHGEQKTKTPADRTLSSELAGGEGNPFLLPRFLSVLVDQSSVNGESKISWHHLPARCRVPWHVA